eukprot:TRINITY_DN27082_c0_g2_i1.p1 TRINITY_DN27082_c0_g2~~TRINITY_DN27082_c0_g2_i1.p1  ORF type:complete len:239 (-),score=30.66 TRINITY_DN27082_c0_g2_i1:83-799(-)
MKVVITGLIASKTTFTFDALLSRGADLEGYIKSQQQQQTSSSPSSSSSPPDALPLSNDINGWSLLGLIVLGVPHVPLTRTVTIAALFYGFYDVVQVHESAQTLRQHRWGVHETAVVSSHASGDEEEKAIWANAAEKEQVAKALKELEGDQLFIEMPVDDMIRNIEGVASLLTVTYRGKDVTSIARRELFDPTTNIVRFEGINLDKTFQFSSFWSLFERMFAYVPVSYTHLTLPTKRIV